VHQLSAGWYGNDTSWRMVLDLNHIAVYGNMDGSIAGEPVRKIYSLCDAIIAGQGDGPLHPDPLPMGMMSFTNNSAYNDICMSQLMGFDMAKIPLLKHSRNLSQNRDIKLSLNGEEVTEEDLKAFSIKTIPPSGWKDYLK
jgi:hypothetical protein